MAPFALGGVKGGIDVAYCEIGLQLEYGIMQGAANTGVHPYAPLVTRCSKESMQHTGVPLASNLRCRRV